MRTYLKALFLSILVTQGVLVLRYSAGLSWAKGPGAAATARRPYLILVPVVNTNPRRQRRLLKNLCGLEYPPREDVTVSFLADAASMSILERKGLEECGYMVETHLEAAGARQAKDAAERHSLSVQMERRRMIAESRNTLLDSSLGVARVRNMDRFRPGVYRSENNEGVGIERRGDCSAKMRER